MALLNAPPQAFLSVGWVSIKPSDHIWPGVLRATPTTTPGGQKCWGYQCISCGPNLNNHHRRGNLCRHLGDTWHRGLCSGFLKHTESRSIYQYLGFAYIDSKSLSIHARLPEDQLLSLKFFQFFTRAATSTHSASDLFIHARYKAQNLLFKTDFMKSPSDNTFGHRMECLSR